MIDDPRSGDVHIRGMWRELCASLWIRLRRPLSTPIHLHQALMDAVLRLRENVIVGDEFR